MEGQPTIPSSVPEPAWRALRQLDPQVEEMADLATCLALAELRFRMLFGDILPRFGETDSTDLGTEADVLADAQHALTLLQESLQVTSRRMLDVLDRVSRELGE